MKKQVNILLRVLFLFTMVACGGGKEETQKVLRPVRYGTVMLSGSGQAHTFSGTAQASTETRLSFRVSGTITNVSVKVGQRVQVGQLIAQMDGTDYNVSLGQALAQLKSSQTQISSAKAQLVNARSNFERVELLYQNNSLPLSDYDQAKSSYEAAQSQYEASLASVAAAQKQVESAQNQVSYTSLTAPISGIITQVHVEENELVASGNPVVALSTTGEPEIQLGVPENFISRIRSGQEVEIHFSTLQDGNFKGTVSEVGFSADGATTYPVIIQIAKPSEDIRPGMAATVTFQFGGNTQGEKASYLISPVAAIGEDDKGNYVFKLEKTGDNYTAKRASVEIGELLPSGFEITKGLKEGDRVATAGIKTLLDGMQVQLMEDEQGGLN